MIYNICNKGNEHHIDSFYKIAIIEATQLAYFSNLSTDTKIEDIITNLPETSMAFITDLLLNNVQIMSSSILSANGKLYTHTINFTITPQDKNIQNLLEQYINTEVVVLISKRNTAHLYGTSLQPLLFNYSELNSPIAGAVKGYNVSVTGKTYGSCKIFENIDFNIYQRGLAFELAQEI